MGRDWKSATRTCSAHFMAICRLGYWLLKWGIPNKKGNIFFRGVEILRLRDASWCQRWRFCTDAETRHNREFAAYTKQQTHKKLSNARLDFRLLGTQLDWQIHWWWAAATNLLSAHTHAHTHVHFLLSNSLQFSSQRYFRLHLKSCLYSPAETTGCSSSLLVFLSDFSHSASTVSIPSWYSLCCLKWVNELRSSDFVSSDLSDWWIPVCAVL